MRRRSSRATDHLIFATLSASLSDVSRASTRLTETRPPAVCHSVIVTRKRLRVSRSAVTWIVLLSMTNSTAVPVRTEAVTLILVRQQRHDRGASACTRSEQAS